MSEAQARRSVADKLRSLLTLLDEPSTLEDADSPAPQSGVATARFSLVGLDDVRERLGPRWPALSSQVHRLAESVIAGHMTKGDVFEKQGETGYVVLFAQLSKAEADFKCRVMAKEITTQLLGSEWQSLATIEATFTEVPREALDLDDLEAALSDAFDRGQRVVTSEVDGGERGLIQERECPPLSGWTEQVWERKAPAFKIDFEGSAANGKACPQRDLSLALDEQISADWARGIGWRYLPIWDFNQRAVLYFRIVPAGEQARLVQRAKAATDVAAEHALFECDIRALKRAIGDVVRLSAAQRRLPLVATVHVPSIAQEARRREFLRVLREQPRDIRRLLTLSMTSPPELPDTRSIADFVQGLQSMKVGVRLTVPVSRCRPLNSLERSVNVVTAELPQHISSEADCMRMLDRFAAPALKAKVDCHAMGLSTRSMVLSAVAAGFRYLSGPAVHAPMEALGQATRLDLRHLYQGLSPNPAA